MKLYKIRGWGKLFENNRSRDLKSLSWVVMPNKHDGENYSMIMRHEKAAEIFAGWVLTLQIASKCAPRGTLIKGNGVPHTPHSLAVKSQAPAGWFETALDYLENNTDWIEVEEVAINPAPTCGNPAPRDEERREGKGKKEGREMGDASLLSEVFNAWNAQNGIPQCLLVSDKRRRSLEIRLQEPFFSKNWRAALDKVSRSGFCKGESDRGWKATFDWFITPDAVVKIMEGKYDGNTNSKASNPNPRNFGIVRGPTDYATAKPRLQREREAAEAARVAGQVATVTNNSPATIPGGE